MEGHLDALGEPSEGERQGIELVVCVLFVLSPVCASEVEHITNRLNIPNTKRELPQFRNKGIRESRSCLRGGFLCFTQSSNGHRTSVAWPVLMERSAPCGVRCLKVTMYVD